MTPSYRTLLIAPLLLIVIACGDPASVSKKMTPPAPNFVVPEGSSPQCYIGEVVGAHRHAIYSEVNAKVVSVMVKPGETFAPGDTLMVMDNASVKTELRRLTKRIDADKAALDKLIQNRDRTKVLFAQDAVDSASLDQLNYDVAEKKHLIEAAKADMQSQMIQLKRHRITAPFSGRMLRTSVESGEYLAQGQIAVEITQTGSDNEIEIDIGVQDIDNWRFAQELKVRHKGVTTRASIIETEQTLNQALYRLKLRSDGLIAMPGEQILVCTDSANQIWKVPVSAVKMMNGEAFIWVEHTPRQSHLVPVTLRDANDKFFFLSAPGLPSTTLLAEDVGIAQQWLAHRRAGQQQ